MCGIVGEFGFGRKRVTPDNLIAMIDTIRHRGPDVPNLCMVPVEDHPVRLWEGTGETAESFLGVAHARLKFVDLTDYGAQPMIDRKTGNVIVFNGEVHNYVELRHELETLGHTFVGNSDTEVLLIAYREYGDDAFPLLNGMWAAVIWDTQRQQLVMSRDRFGSKPLYIRRDSETLLFASEIKAILAHPTTSARVNHDTVARYISRHWRWVDSSRDTFFADVAQLEPGTVCRFDRDGSVSSARFWDLRDHMGVREDLTEREAVCGLRDLLMDSVNIRLRSDVPVGHLLSGGLDSSAIIGTADQITEGAIETVSARFSEPSSDEGLYIHSMTKSVNARAHEVWVNADDAIEAFPDVLRYSDEPLSTPSWLAHWRLMQTAQAAGLQVLTDGLGGDELFAGYHSHHVCYLADLEATGDPLFSHELARWMKMFGLEEPDYRLAARRAQRLRARSLSTADPLVSFMTSSSPVDAQSSGKQVGTAGAASITPTLLTDAYSRQHPVSLDRDNPPSTSLLASHLYQDITHEAVPSVVRPSDRSSMAFGIEIRSPFLDHRLVEFAFSLPPRFMIRDGATKWLLRQAIKDIVPDMVRNRTDKQGINIPSTTWLRGSWEAPFRSVLSSPDLAQRGILDQDAVLAMLDQHVSGQGNHYLDLWHCYNLELWMRQYG